MQQANSSDVNHYKSLATYYKNLAVIKRVDATVHVEGKDDVLFWEAMFSQFVPHKKFYFVPYSKSPKGNDTSGVEQCLKYKPYLSRRFFICIDSDYRYLMQVKGYDTLHLIFQTYTYSFENHLCHPQGLSEACERVAGVENKLFSFDRFVKDFSAIVYKLFLWHLYYVEQGSYKLTKKQFADVISGFKLPPDSDIKNNYQSILSELKRRVGRKFAELNVDREPISFEELKNHYTKLGVNSTNVYRFVRGHDVCDLLCLIGKRISEKLISMNKKQNEAARASGESKSFASEIWSNMHFGKYPEIQKIEKDIKQFFAQ